MSILRFAPIVTFLAALTASAPAQVVEPKPGGVSMGHLHLNSSDPAAQRKFWVDVLGARVAKLGPAEVFAVPGMLVMVKKAEPTGGTDGSVVVHIGVRVKDLDAVMARVKAAGLKVVSLNDAQGMIDGPDGLRTELTKDTNAPEPLMCHHIHFATPEIAPTQKWYADTFGAIPGKRGRFEAADLPGVNLSFNKSDSALPGTKGRVLDHIGFEVRNLEAFTRKLEASGVKFDIPYRKVPSLGIAIAFFTDPWGTYIELTEGLAQVK